MWDQIVKENFCEQDPQPISHIFLLNSKNINEWESSNVVKAIENHHQNMRSTKTKYLQIHLNSNCIGSIGCQHLSLADFKSLYLLSLTGNSIGDKGCLYISKAKWQQLSNLQLTYNQISSQGCKYLCEANWKELSSLVLNYNRVSSDGCKYLCLASWENLKVLDLTNNNIEPKGFRNLSQANWPSLQSISILNENEIIWGEIDFTKSKISRCLNEIPWTHIWQ